MKRIALFAFVFLATPLAARAERLPLKSYTTADGLAHNVINDIVRDSRGFLWFCTDEGLSRFDGYQFTNYGVNDGLPDPAVTTFLETRSGDLWVGTRSGLVRFNPTGASTPRAMRTNERATAGTVPMFTLVVPDNDDRRSRSISALAESRDGRIWVGTASGLYRLDAATGMPRLQPIDAALVAQSALLDLLEDASGSLWVASFAGVSRRWPDGSAALYANADGLPDKNVHDLFQDREGQLWAGTRLGGFFRIRADETHAAPIVGPVYAARDGLGTDWVFRLFQTSDRRFWIATNRGVAEFDPDAAEHGRRPFKTYTQRNGLIYYGVTTLAEDAAGNLWLGTDAGAMKLARDGPISYGEQDGLLSVFAVFGDRAGNVCFRASLFGDELTTVFEGAKYDLSRPPDHYYTRYGCFDGQKFNWFRPGVLNDEQLGWVGEMVTLQGRRSGEWWLGTGAGVYRFAPAALPQLKGARPIAVYTTNDGLSANQVFRLFEDARGGIWASTIQPNGLARFDPSDGRWHDYTHVAALPSSRGELARSFGEDCDGNVWIGFASGAARYRDGTFTFFGEKSGLGAGVIQSIYRDHTSRLWLATSRMGVIRVDNPGAEHPTFSPFASTQGLSSDSAAVLVEDGAGSIYIGTGRGLDRLDPATGHLTRFTTADGLAPGQIEDAFRANDGSLWFGTTKGLSRYAPSTAAPPQPPRILITALQVAGVRHAISALGESTVVLPSLASDRNNLQLEYVGLDFTAGETLRYQYRFDSPRAEWSRETSDRTVNFASLAPGRYRVLVRAVSSQGQASPTPAVVAFTILPPLWQRWWALALAACVVTLAVYAIYRNRIARVVEFAGMRMRIATDLHDDIGANLTKIAVLSEVAMQQHRNRADGADAGPLASIARIARESVASMGDIVWAINPERDRLVDLVRRMRRHAEDMLSARDVDLAFNAPLPEQQVKLGADVRRDVLLIFKEAINNAARHANCSRVSVDFGVQGGRLTLRVADDGVGFDSAREGDGQGLPSMRSRAERLGGSFTVDSRPGAGTIVRVAIPISVGERHRAAGRRVPTSLSR